MNRIKTLLQKELREAGWHSRGYLPHFDGGEIAQTINLHLADSLPQAVLEKWKGELARDAETRSDVILRRRIEHYLDQGYGSCALRIESVAQMVQDSLLHFDAVRYRIPAWAIMPNHVHMLLTPFEAWSLSQIMKDMKSFTAHEANKILRRLGQFWMEEYFDRYVRDAKHFSNATAYIENNPVRARLCARPEDWVFSSAYWRRKA